jgi:major vault protein
MSETREKRDLVLAPGTYAYMQDVTKGQIIVFTGPTVINQTAQEVPVIYEPQDGTFCRCGTLEEAVRQAPIAVEGYYLILKNPARKAEHPMEGGRQISPELDVGRKINIPGPCMFALWPGQDALVVRGHHLRSNQYLLVRVYNEEEAKKNWAMAVVKPASSEPGGTAPAPDSAPVATAPVPRDLTVGKQLIIRGTEVSFYIPPTGIGVVSEGADESGKPRYVRSALTLERLEYCILVDENGNKRYERGPRVVFPEPTERVVESEDGGKKFRAIELNEIQGLHIKVIAPYRDEQSGKTYKEGDELFITGKETAIYFPRQEHSLISYDGKSKHFATAIPAGEARYVMNRMTGALTMAKGPAMLLPDPRTEVIVRRVLSDKQVELWYPGNQEALEYNRQLRQLLSTAPTTRQGAISEGDYERGMRKAKAEEGVQRAQRGMEQSRVSGDQAVVAGDEFTRGSSYTQPRTVTLDTKFQGVPSTDIWTGYAIMIVSKTGKRRVERGPTTVLLEYDESLEVLDLSTGKPKTTDNLIRTVFLRVMNNKVSDIINVETADHVSVQIYLSHRVNFEDDPTKWFDVENYVKFLCDHVRSVLKGALKKVRVEDFYANSVEIVRDVILGKQAEDGKRHGMFFPENGMRVSDVEVLRVTIGDERIRQLLEEAQHDVVKSHIELTSAHRGLEVTRQQEQVEREIAETKALTTRRHHELEVEVIGSQLAVLLAKIGSELRQAEERKRAEGARQAVLDLGHDGDLGRQRRATEQGEELARAAQEREIERLRAEAEAMVSRFQAAQPGFSEALLALSHEETVVKVAEALSVQNFLGGKNFAEVVQKVFAGTPLQPLMERITTPREDGDGRRKKGQPAATPAK